MKITSIKETCIYVTDLERTRHFYAELLQLPVISLVEERHVFFKAGSSVLLCFIASKTLNENELPPHGATGKMHFAFEVEKEDYDATLAQVTNCGISITHHHQWPNGTRSFYFSDPDEHVLEVIEKGLWPA